MVFPIQVLVEQLAVCQENSEREVRGPPAAKAFDAQGNFMKVKSPVSHLHAEFSAFINSKVWT